MSDYSIESLIAVGTGLVSRESYSGGSTSTYKSDGYHDEVSAGLERASEDLKFLDTFALVSNRNATDKIRMLKKIKATYGFRSHNGNSNACASIESFCNRQIHSLEETQEATADATSAPADKPDTTKEQNKEGENKKPNEQKKKWYQKLWGAIKKLWEFLKRKWLDFVKWFREKILRQKLDKLKDSGAKPSDPVVPAEVINEIKSDSAFEELVISVPGGTAGSSATRVDLNVSEDDKAQDEILVVSIPGGTAGSMARREGDFPDGSKHVTNTPALKLELNQYPNIKQYTSLTSADVILQWLFNVKYIDNGFKKILEYVGRTTLQTIFYSHDFLGKLNDSYNTMSKRGNAMVSRFDKAIDSGKADDTVKSVSDSLKIVMKILTAQQKACGMLFKQISCYADVALSSRLLEDEISTRADGGEVLDSPHDKFTSKTTVQDLDKAEKLKSTYNASYRKRIATALQKLFHSGSRIMSIDGLNPNNCNKLFSDITEFFENASRLVKVH